MASLEPAIPASGMYERMMANHQSHEQGETLEERDVRLEMEHFNGIVKSFKQYESWLLARFDQKEADWVALPEHYKHMIPNMPQKFKFTKFCINENQAFINRIIDPQCLVGMMGNEHERFPFVHDAKGMDLDKVKSTLRQCLRDWSAVGVHERDMCYKPILEALVKLFPEKQARRQIQVLNPGCGLGRLTWEIASMGFPSQGNEFSYHMLLCSNLILNHSVKQEEFAIYPYIDAVANVWRYRDQCRKISIPDVHPRSLPNDAQFSMVAGDFLDVYKEPNSWDVVVTCFFIDTAKNVFDYLTTLSLVIPEGGYWINLGPLLYHFEDMNESSIELTYEELRAIIPQFGFEFIDEKLGMSSTYARNELSMLQMAYNSAFFVCRKTQTPPCVVENPGRSFGPPGSGYEMPPPGRPGPPVEDNLQKPLHDRLPFPPQQQRNPHGHNRGMDNRNAPQQNFI